MKKNLSVLQSIHNSLSKDNFCIHFSKTNQPQSWAISSCTYWKVILHASTGICGPAWIHVNTTVTDRCTHSFFNFFEKIKCKSNIKITCKYFLIYWYNVALRESYDIVPLTIVKKKLKGNQRQHIIVYRQ